MASAATEPGVSYVRDIDPIPNTLSKSLREGKCVLFLGAGASLAATDRSNARLPSWKTMVDELVQLVIDETAPSADICQELRDLQSWGELLALSEWIDSELNSLRFAEYLQNRLGTASNSLVHEILAKKSFAAVVTTNYDDLAEQHWRAEGRKPIVLTPHTGITEIAQARRLLSNPLHDQMPILKPHGTWEHPATLVFGPRAYREIMYNNEPFRAFMYDLFANYMILFVGFSFRDPNLQSLLQWAYTRSEGQMPTHYATLENRGAVVKRFMLKNFSLKLLTYPVPPTDHSECLKILRAL